MPVTVSHALSMTTLQEAKRVRKNAANKRWYEKNRMRILGKLHVIALTLDDATLEKRRASAKRRYESNKEKHAANGKCWRENNRERRSVTDRQRYEVNKEARRASHLKWQAANKDRVRAYQLAGIEGYRARSRAWAKRHPDKVFASVRKRQALKLRALPLWADDLKIASFYAEARKRTIETGVKHHVDHIVPLKGKNVCGLHCEANLQVMIGRENQSKGNKCL